MTLEELCSILKINNHCKNKKIKRIVTDSRKVNKGDIFIALKGNNYDGNDYLDEALKKGAIACITNRANNKLYISVKNTYESLYIISNYIRNKYFVPLIAITGSNGKTTTKDLISFILNSKFNVLKNEGNKNNIIGVSETLFKLKKDHNVIVIELGSNHLGEIEYLSKMCNPNTAIITNIGSSHLEHFKNKKNIYKEKMSIINGNSNMNLIINGDDKYLKKLKCYKCGINNTNNLIAYNINEYDMYISFNIYLDKEYEVIFNNPFKHFITDILLAIKVCLDYNVDINTIIKKIGEFKLTKMRMNIINNNNYTIINDCYNSSFESLKAGLTYLKRKNNKKIIILGDILELGKKTKYIHKKINKELNSIKNKEVLTVGNYTKYIKSKHFDSNKKIINYLKNLDLTDCYMYVKGSRKMNMEEIVECLTIDECCDIIK